MTQVAGPRLTRSLGPRIQVESVTASAGHSGLPSEQACSDWTGQLELAMPMIRAVTGPGYAKGSQILPRAQGPAGPGPGTGAGGPPRAWRRPGGGRGRRRGPGPMERALARVQCYITTPRCYFTPWPYKTLEVLYTEQFYTSTCDSVKFK